MDGRARELPDPRHAFFNVRRFGPSKGQDYRGLGQTRRVPVGRSQNAIVGSIPELSYAACEPLKLLVVKKGVGPRATESAVETRRAPSSAPRSLSRRLVRVALATSEALSLLRWPNMLLWPVAHLCAE
eukprot:scaffold4131_cov227-Pinguiococcus_pyrenoidosus.AAC.3